MKKIIFTSVFSGFLFLSKAQMPGDTCSNSRFNPSLTSFAFATTNTTQIIYGVSSTTNVARVYTPAGDINTCRPVIIWAHGGGFTGGTYLEQKTTEMMVQLARKGYVGIAMRYRLWPTTPANTQQYQEAMIRGVQDMIAAVRYVRANANTLGVDTAQIFVGGSSAGAIIANHTTFMDLSEAFAVPIANQGGNYNVSTLPTFTNTSYHVAGCITQAGSIWDLNFLNGETTPWGAVHNTTDPTVPLNSGGGSLQIFNQLQTQNVKSFIKLTYSNNLHTPFPLSPTAPYVDTFNVASYTQLFSLLKHQGTASVTANVNTLTAVPSGLAYQWYLNNIAIPSATLLSHVAISNGNYKVQIKNCTNCFSMSQNINITTTSINSNSENNTTSVFPVPFNKELTINGKDIIESIQLNGIDAKMIYYQTLNSKTTTISIADLESGVYFLTVKYANSKTNIIKVIKE